MTWKRVGTITEKAEKEKEGEAKRT